jgi:multidrug transporter EmrE-like cation transporter
MKNLLLSPWLAVALCAVLSTLTDTLGTLWWEKKDISILLGTIFLSPLVFLCFGYVGRHFGLAIASSLTNTLIVAGPILVGFTLRQEIRRLSLPQMIGMTLLVAGITLLAGFRPPAD